MEIHKEDVRELYKMNMDKIEENRKKFEKHTEMVEAIKELDANKEKSDELEEDETIEAGYIDEETTNQEETADFEKYVKELARKQIDKYNEGIETLQEDIYLDLVNRLNLHQRRFCDDFVERINSGIEDEPFYLYIRGEAGTGKSYLLRLMIDAVKQLGKRSGRELDKPVSLTIAPTGVAAYLVNGTTIESALGMQPHQLELWLG